MGQERAEQAAHQLIDVGANRLVSFGTAGGLSKEIKSGDLCIPKKVICSSPEEFQVNDDWHANTVALLKNDGYKLHTAPIFSASEVADSVNKKLSINDNTHAITIDMESAAILQAAKERQLPCLVLRAIVDTVNMSLPASALKHTDPFGKTNLVPLVCELLTHPSQIPPIIKLASSFRAATNTLKLVARKLEQL